MLNRKLRLARYLKINIVNSNYLLIDTHIKDVIISIAMTQHKLSLRALQNICFAKARNGEITLEFYGAKTPGQNGCIIDTAYIG